MKLKLYSLLFMVAAAGMVSCKTAGKLYEKGNYDEAVELAAKKLQKKPGDPELTAVIRDAYRYAVDDHENRIREYGQSSNDLKWEWIYNEYLSLQRLYDAIFRVPSVFDLVAPVDYSSYIVTYREKAGENRYERGIAFMQRYDKQSYRNAYREFQAALRFLPGDVGVIQKMDEAWEYAVTNVVILPMQQQGGYVYSSYTVGGQNLDDQLLRNLQYNSGSEFVRFYSAWDARNRGIRVDRELGIRLLDAHIGRPYETSTSRKVTKEVVVKETVYKPDSVVKEYAKVQATVIKTRRTLNSRAIMEITLRDEQGRWVWSDRLNGDHSWATEFHTYTGDKRALGETDIQLIERRREFAPTESEIMRHILDDIQQNSLYRIRNYFNRT